MTVDKKKLRTITNVQIKFLLKKKEVKKLLAWKENCWNKYDILTGMSGNRSREEEYGKSHSHCLHA